MQSISSSAKARLCGVAPELADPVGSLEVGEHQDVEKLVAGSGAEGVQALAEPALQLVGSHGRRLRRGPLSRVMACLSADIHEHWRIKACGQLPLAMV